MYLFCVIEDGFPNLSDLQQRNSISKILVSILVLTFFTVLFVACMLYVWATT